MDSKISAPSFRNIGLMGRPNKASVVESIKLIIDEVRTMGLNLILDQQTADIYPDEFRNTQVVRRSLLGEVCDLVIVVGGDGSILHATQALAKSAVPVLGVNRGRLGFLTDVNPNELTAKLKQVLAGNYELDHRSLLQLEIYEDDALIYEDMALNDVVLHAGKSVHMIDFELSIDGHYVYRQHSDGLIVSTATGSTAYALSGGGPIVHPCMDAMVLVPMHPHTLSSRPIVVSGNSEVKLHIHDDNRTQPMISADGRSSVTIYRKQVIYIRKHPYKLTLLHPPGFDFYAACRTKLGWSRFKENE